MTKQALPLFSVLMFSLPAFAQIDQIERHCHGEWPTSISMRASCVSQEIEGATDVMRFFNAHGITGENIAQRGRDGDPAAVIAAECVAEWRPEYSEAAACMEQRAAAPSNPASAAAGVEPQALKAFPPSHGFVVDGNAAVDRNAVVDGKAPAERHAPLRAE